MTVISSYNMIVERKLNLIRITLSMYESMCTSNSFSINILWLELPEVKNCMQNRTKLEPYNSHYQYFYSNWEQWSSFRSACIGKHLFTAKQKILYIRNQSVKTNKSCLTNQYCILFCNVNTISAIKERLILKANNLQFGTVVWLNNIKFCHINNNIGIYHIPNMYVRTSHNLAEAEIRHLSAHTMKAWAYITPLTVFTVLEFSQLLI